VIPLMDSLFGSPSRALKRYSQLRLHGTDLRHNFTLSGKGRLGTVLCRFDLLLAIFHEENG
jgi:hypothetical protein